MKPVNILCITFLAGAVLLQGGLAGAGETLRISYVRAPFNLQSIVMKERGLLEQRLAPLGVGVEWLEMTSGARQAQTLASGHLDIGGVMNTTSVLMANGEGNPVRIVAGVARPTDVFALVAAKGGVAGIGELRGKTVAGPKGTVLHQLLIAALAREGMNINDVNFAQMDIPQAFSALQSGRVDAALLAANMLIHAEKEGARILSAAAGLVTPILTMTASEKFLKEHPERVRAAVAAHDDAWAWISANLEEALSLGARVQDISPEEARKLYDWSHFTQRLDAGDIESMRREMQFMLDNGMMRRRIDAASIVLPQAMREEK
ncbi:MAG: NrtA/SsuA/CpmA family ABC transporter substrate-binding protein [Candidatus Accumulibacter sp.]|jgi:NitT/TauT family transport system substrate-binding protein/sulfonate transport system substrate-binding protein|nr:NrtA/SsuA/CpmA family ABC transporter substrate-binding protein [Accumulibacter sp.]